MQESEDLGELEFIDLLSMEQHAEFLTNELRDQLKQQEPDQQGQLDQCTGISLEPDIINADVSMLSFASRSSRQLSFLVQEPIKQDVPWMERKFGQRVHEHAIAERMRREKMHQQFATLVSTIPDITKVNRLASSHAVGGNKQSDHTKQSDLILPEMGY